MSDVETSQGTMRARRAVSDDKRVVWEWWNDATTRAMMKLSKPVPWEEHDKWFDQVVISTEKLLYMALLDGERVGVTRFDHKGGGHFEVSINLAPNLRGRHVGRRMLGAAIDELVKAEPVTRLFGMFKLINVASRRCFEANAFITRTPTPGSLGIERFEPGIEGYCERLFPPAGQ